jgi:hypothetical protein
MMMKSFLIATIVFSATITHALEMDEKLTLRFLKVSNSKKTILINRGAEDGLAVGDHAKFFITSGVIARGVVEKLSPSRSIWSLYRVVDPAEITDGKVLNLKIASPVKITEDPSKSLKEEPIPGGTEKMEMNETAVSHKEVDATVVDEADKKELEGLGIEEEKPISKSNGAKTKSSDQTSKKIQETSAVEPRSSERVFINRDWEIWSALNLSMLTGTTTDPAATAGTANDATNSRVDFTAGFEKYFSDSHSEFWKKISISAFGTIQLNKSAAGATTTTTQHLNIGLGGSYHFLNPADSIGKFISFGNISFGVGNNTSTTETESATTDLKGAENFFSVGVGSKYYLASGVGFRGIVDFYHQSSGLDYPASGAVESRTVTTDLNGFRFQLGMSYRF